MSSTEEGEDLFIELKLILLKMKTISIHIAINFFIN